MQPRMLHAEQKSGMPECRIVKDGEAEAYMSQAGGSMFKFHWFDLVWICCITRRTMDPKQTEPMELLMELQPWLAE